MPATTAALKRGTAAASFSISVHTWARARTSARNFIVTGTTLPSQSSSSLPSFSLAALHSNTRGLRLTSCARVASLSNFYHYNFSNQAATNNNLNNDVINTKKNTFLGFPFRVFPFFSHPSPFSSPRVLSSSTRSGSNLSPPSGSDIVAGMESENKVVDDVDWYRDDSLKTSQIQQPSSSPNDHRCHQHNKLLTLPTVLTLGRVAAVPLLVATFYVDCWWGRTATTSIFIVAAITDWLDGYLARKMRLGTSFGAFLDPVADKLMVAATLILLCSKPLEVGMFEQFPWLMTVPTVAIIGREITMSAVREWAASQSSKLLEAVAVNNLGKWKTATQMTALIILLAARDSSLGGSEFLVTSGIVFLYISAGLSVWSLVVYMSKIWKVLLK